MILTLRRIEEHISTIRFEFVETSPMIVQATLDAAQNAMESGRHGTALGLLNEVTGDRNQSLILHDLLDRNPAYCTVDHDFGIVEPEPSVE